MWIWFVLTLKWASRSLRRRVSACWTLSVENQPCCWCGPTWLALGCVGCVSSVAAVCWETIVSSGSRSIDELKLFCESPSPTSSNSGAGSTIAGCTRISSDICWLEVSRWESSRGGAWNIIQLPYQLPCMGRSYLLSWRLPLGSGLRVGRDPDAGGWLGIFWVCYVLDWPLVAHCVFPNVALRGGRPKRVDWKIREGSTCGSC